MGRKNKNRKTRFHREIADPIIQEKLKDVELFLNTKTSAKWWIENRKLPGFAFFIYGLYNSTGENKINYNTIQTLKVDGVVKTEKAVPTIVSLGDTTKSRNPAKIIQELQIERTFHYETEEISYKSKKEEFLGSEDSDIIYPAKLLSSGWALDPECIIFRFFTHRNRISGDDVACWVFTKA